MRPYLTMATAFGPEGCVILSMLAKIAPETYVFNLDTGYQFQETLDLRDRIAEKYGIEVDLLQPELTVPEYEALHGGPLYKTNPNQCCFDRKIKVLSRAAVGMHAWMSGIRRDQSTDRAKAADRRLGQEIWAREDQPAGELDEEGRVEADPRRERAVQSAARPRLPEHRLLACTRAVAPTRPTNAPAAGAACKKPSAACTRSENRTVAVFKRSLVVRSLCEERI